MTNKLAKFFTRSLTGYLSLLKAVALILAAVGLLRLVAKPLLGLPLAPGGTIFSLTYAVVILLAWYGISSALRGDNVGDVLILGLGLVLLFQVITAVALFMSEALGLDNYYLDPVHFAGTVPFHVWIHFRTTPRFLLYGLIISLIFFGATWLIAGRKPKANVSS